MKKCLLFWIQVDDIFHKKRLEAFLFITQKIKTIKYDDVELDVIATEEFSRRNTPYLRYHFYRKDTYGTNVKAYLNKKGELYGKKYTATSVFYIDDYDYEGLDSDGIVHEIKKGIKEDL